MGAFDHVDEVWAGSRFVADALAAVAPVPVVRVPHAGRAPEVRPAVAARRSGCPRASCSCSSSTTTASSSARTRSGCSRRSCARSRSPAMGATLVLKTINAEHHPRRARAAPGRGARPRTSTCTCSTATSRRDDKHRLLAAATATSRCTAPRASASTMAEAMLLGKPVDRHGLLGQPRLHDAGEQLPRRARAAADRRRAPIPTRPTGNGPSRTSITPPRCMREVFEHPEDAAARGAQAAEDVATRALARGRRRGDGRAAAARPRRDSRSRRAPATRTRVAGSAAS